MISIGLRTTFYKHTAVLKLVETSPDDKNNPRVVDGSLWKLASFLWRTAESDPTIEFFDPDPRGIIPLETFHIPRSLRKLIRKGIFKVTYNSCFSKRNPGVFASIKKSTNHLD